MGTRTFVVKVSESEPRVVIEDVRTRERVVAPRVEGVGETIARLLEAEPPGAGPRARARATRPPGGPPA